MTTQLLVAATVYAAIIGLCLWRPPAGRRALGVLFAITGLAVNGAVLTVAPGLFVDLARAAPWAWYRAAGLAMTEPAPRAFGVAMLVIEVGLAVLILCRGRWARMGLLGAAAFLVGITPLGLYTLANPVLAAGALYLARRAWPVAAFARSAARPPGPTATPAHRYAQPDQPARPPRLP